MSGKECKNKISNITRMELVAQRETKLIHDYRGTRPRKQRKKYSLLKRIYKTKKEREVIQHKLNRDNEILESQVNELIKKQV